MGHNFLSHSRMKKELLQVANSEKIEWTNVEGSGISSIIVSGRSTIGGSAERCPSPPTRLDNTEVHIPERGEKKARDPELCPFLTGHPCW